MSRGKPSKETKGQSGATGSKSRARRRHAGTHQFFDKLLKRLAQPLTVVLLPKLMNQQVLEIKELDREITRIRSSRKHLDYLARVRVSGEGAAELLVHLEFQTKNDRDMAVRMLEYGLEVYRKYKRYPYQVVVYLGNEPISMDKCFKHYLGDVHVDYCTSMLGITSLDPLDLLSLQDIPEMPLLAALSLKDRDPAAPRVFPEILKALASQDRATRNESLVFLEVIAQSKHLLNILQEVRTMFDIKLEDIPTIKKIKEEGKKEGLKEGAIKTILRLMKKKYQLSKQQEQHVKQLLEQHSLKKLNSIADLLITPISLNDLLDKIKE